MYTYIYKYMYIHIYDMYLKWPAALFENWNSCLNLKLEERSLTSGTPFGYIYIFIHRFKNIHTYLYMYTYTCKNVSTRLFD